MLPLLVGTTGQVVHMGLVAPTISAFSLRDAMLLMALGHGLRRDASV